MFDFFIFRSRFEQRRASGVNDRRFAVQSFDYDSREEFMRFEFSCFWITHWEWMSDHPPFFAGVQSTAILLKSNPALKQTMNRTEEHRS
jgi:hypothetical protein